MNVHPFSPIFSNRLTINSAQKDISNNDLPNKESLLVLDAIQSFLLDVQLTTTQLNCLELVCKSYFKIKNTEKQIFESGMNSLEIDLKDVKNFDCFIYMAFADSTLYYTDNRSIFCPKGSILYCKNENYQLKATFKKSDTLSGCFFIYQ